jgi:hypothetical protein
MAHTAFALVHTSPDGAEASAVVGARSGHPARNKPQQHQYVAFPVDCERMASLADPGWV